MVVPSSIPGAVWPISIIRRFLTFWRKGDSSLILYLPRLVLGSAMSPRSPGSCRGEWYTEATLRVQSARMAMGGPRLPGPPRTRSRRRGQERTEFRTTRMHLRTLDGRHSTHAYTHTFVSPVDSHACALGPQITIQTPGSGPVLSASPSLPSPV